MLTALASAITVNGDYLSISLLQSKELLGVYFFGFQLSLALVALVTSSLDTVMMPTFSTLSADTKRQTDMFLRAARLLAIGATFACFALVVASPAGIHALWGGKWDEAIPVVQLLSLTMPIRLMIPLCRAMLEARGEWRVMSVLSISDGMGIILAGALGAWTGELLTITGVVSGYNLVSGLLYCGVVARRLLIPLGTMFTPILSTFGVGIVAIVMGPLFITIVQSTPMSLWQTPIFIGVYGAIYFALMKAFMGNSLTELRTIVMNFDVVRAR